MGKHAEWRKQAKKIRRKRIRSVIAIARDQQLLEERKRRELSPTYKAWLEEQTILEDFKTAEEKRLAMERQKRWEDEDEAALLRWREQQSRIAQAKAEKFKKEIMIKEEWEREQQKLQEAKKKSEDEKKRKQAELLARIDAFIEGNAELPDEVNVSTQTQPGHPDCPFFSKTGACRFRDSCSRNHARPGISRTLLIPNFYDHFGLQTLHHDEYDTDLSLEYEDSETYQHFKEFYKDVLPEFELCGRVTQFKVCNNEEPHLRGNVYVEFYSRRHALKAYRTFQGRFYAGRRLNVEFSSIPSWKNAICGLFHKQKCPKGKTCNFLHVFQNPNNAFRVQDGHSSSRRQFSKSRSRSPVHHTSRSRDWKWSDGSGSDNDTKRKRSRSHSRNKVFKKNHGSSSEDNNPRSRSRSPNKNKVRSRRYDTNSRERRKKHGKDRNREKYRSLSKSPSRDRKHKKSDSRDDSHKKNRKDRGDNFKSSKEFSEREDSCKRIKSNKDQNKKKNSKEKSGKDDYDKKYKKERSDFEENCKTLKNRLTEESDSSSLHKSVSEEFSKSDTKGTINGDL